MSDSQPILMVLQVITLQQAALRWNLRPEDMAELAHQLRGKERKMASGNTGYYVSDIEACLVPPRAA